MKRRLLHVVLSFMLGATVSPAQDPVTKGNREVRTFNVEGPPVWPTPLQDNHIALTPEALLAALHHPLSDVRAAAAPELAARIGKDAVAPILAALVTETYPVTRISMAYTAAKLGADEGVAALRSMCRDSSWSPDLRMAAAWAMVIGGHEECLANVMEVIRLHDDSQATIQALNILPWYKHLPAREMQEVRNLVQMSLRSDYSEVRMKASYVLRQWGDSSAMEDVRSALAVEHDETTRGVLAKDLKALEEKQANSPVKAK
jgi:hypothetical protein